MSNFNFSSSIMLSSSGWAYYRWAVSTLFVAIYTWFLYAMEQVSPNQSAIQLSFGLMVGLLSICLAWLVDLTNRKIIIDDIGIQTSRLFQQNKRFYWDELAKINWWQSGKKMINFRLLFADGQLELAFDTVTWKGANEAVSIISEKANCRPQNVTQMATKQWFRRAVSILLVVLGFSLSTLIESDLVHTIGFLTVRVFWIRFLLERPSLNLKTVRGNMIIFTLATLAGIVFISGSNLVNLASWWLYTPLLDIFITYLFQKIKPYFSGRNYQLP